MRFTLFAVLFVSLCAVYAVEAGRFGDMLTSFFDDHRPSRCPAPGVEHELSGKITIKEMNFPKEPCKKHCAEQGLVSIVGTELATFGPKVLCCCKSEEQAAAQ